MPMRIPAISRAVARAINPTGSMPAGSTAPKPYATSATLRASTPGVSNVKERGTIPSVDQRPSVTFRPTLPVMDAGMRTEPAVSLPKASCAEPSRRLTPAPLDEPPTERWALASHGL